LFASSNALSASGALLERQGSAELLEYETVFVKQKAEPNAKADLWSELMMASQNICMQFESSH
jgi:hypothetical protein